MAAAKLLSERLPRPWTYCVTEDGRIFFINEEERRTTWLHPVYQHPVLSGHNDDRDLPRGWEKEYSSEGAPYYIDHANQRTTFSHPVTGETAAVELHPDQAYPQHSNHHGQHQQQQHSPQQRPHFERQKSDMQDFGDEDDDVSKRKSNKVLDRSPSATRCEDSLVSMRGWLYKQDSGGLKSWKKRWFVLADFCLFYYKGPEEGKSLGSVLLPSYRINPCSREDGVNKKFAFKAEHDNMRTYFFCADTQVELKQWMNALSLASILQRDPRSHQAADHQRPGVELELNQCAPSQEASRDESFQSGGSTSVRPLPPATRWTSEQHYTEDNSYYTGYGGGQAPDYPDQESLKSYPHSSEQYGHYTGDAPPPRSPNGHHYADHTSHLGYPDPNSYSTNHPQYKDDHSMFYQPGQLQKQKPLTDLSQFSAESNSDIPCHPDQMYADEVDRGGYSPGGGRWVDQRGDGVLYAQPWAKKRDTLPEDRYQSHPANRKQAPYSYGGSNNRLAPLNIAHPSQPHPQPQRSGSYAHDSARNSVTGSNRYLSERHQAPGSQQSSRAGSQAYPGHSPVLDHLHQWRDRVGNSPRPEGPGSAYGSQQDMGSWQGGDKALHNNNNPIYENLNISQQPGRPPLPATYRDQIVRELAHSKSPEDQREMIASAKRMQRRHETEPLVFQYPEVQDEEHAGPVDASSWKGSHQQMPDPYSKAWWEAEDAARNQQNSNQQWEVVPQGGMGQNYPDAYWKAKNAANHIPSDGYPDPDPKRQSSTSLRSEGRSEPTYSTIPAPEHVTCQQVVPQYQHAAPRSPNMPRADRPETQNRMSYNNTPQKVTYNTTTNSFDITTIKEDPTMEDQDVLATKKLEKLKDHLNGHRLRLSISAGDLVGKSHEELVLLLIQLRRSQSRLGDAHGWYRRQMDVGRPVEKEYRRRRDSEYGDVPEPMEEEHQHYETLRQSSTQVQKQVDISKPLVNLVDNLVTMGSLYGGNNLMLASQYKQKQLAPGQYVPAPKKMIEFSRRHQEAKLTKEQEEQLKQLQEDEADLEDKLQQLYQLDRELQEHSFAVTSLQEDWELLQKALEGIHAQDQQASDVRGLSRLAQQRRTIEQELSKVRQQLAEASKRLEETAADNARVENEVLLLRKKIMKGLDNGGLDKPVEKESMRTKEQLEAELTSVQTMIDGLSKQGAKLGQVMTSLRRSMPDLTEEAEEEPFKKPEKSKASGPTYAETDLDSMETRDLGSNRTMTIFKDKSSRPTSHVYPQSKNNPVREVVSPPDGAVGTYSQPAYAAPPRSGASFQQPTYSKTSQLPLAQSISSKQNRLSLSSHPSYSSQTNHQPSSLPNGSGHHARQSSLPTSLPSSPEHFPHSSITDLRQPAGYQQQHTTHQYQQRPASATFGHQPRLSGRVAPPFASEPNLSRGRGSSEGIEQREAQTVTYSQTSAYNQPPSIAYSEPYGHDPSSSVVYTPDPDTIPDYVNIGPAGEVNNDTAPDSADPDYYPLDINDADDNMKRFYGILPRDKPRATTVRDIKKRESERRGRGRRSYADDDEEEEEEVLAMTNSTRGWRSQSMPRMSSLGHVDREEMPSPLPPDSDVPILKNMELTLQRQTSLNSLKSNSSEENRRSATERLFGAGTGSLLTGAQYDPTSLERVRRMSDIFTPKPFLFGGGSPPKQYRPVSMFNLTTSKPPSAAPSVADVSDDDRPPSVPPPPPPPPSAAAIATVRPVFTLPHKDRGLPGDRHGDRGLLGDRNSFLGDRTIHTATVKPLMSKKPPVTVEDWVIPVSKSRSRAKSERGRRGKDRDRFLTVSSSRPVSVHKSSSTTSKLCAKHQSAAGDLITSTVKGDTKGDYTFDDFTIDKEVLFVPDKVEIPERYIPDSDDEITAEEAVIRQEKSDKIRKILAAQSLQEWRENELEGGSSMEDVTMREELREEKRRREALLDIRQALAREVSQKTRQVAEMHRKATSELELRHVGMHPGHVGGPSSAASFMSLYETPTYERRSVFS